jgi:hypothetical protein
VWVLVSSAVLPFILNYVLQKVCRGVSSIWSVRRVDGDVLMVTAGDHPSAVGVYAISGYRPMLNSSREYVTNCWKDCAEMSQLAG